MEIRELVLSQTKCLQSRSKFSLSIIFNVGKCMRKVKLSFDYERSNAYLTHVLEVSFNTPTLCCERIIVCFLVVFCPRKNLDLNNIIIYDKKQIITKKYYYS